MPASQRRAERKREILDATRALFDERGVRDAQIEDVARAVGINRAIIYRHFSGKEELFAMTLVDYLAELDEALSAADEPTSPPARRLEAITEAFLDFGSGHPAFVDCAQALLRRRGDELFEEVSESVMLKLGVGMTSCLSHVVRVLEAGAQTGEFHVPDPYLLANIFYTQGLGVLNLATLQLSVRGENSPTRGARGETPTGLPSVDAVPFEQVKAYMQRGAVAMARGDVD